MVKSFRFLLNFAWINLGALIAFAAIVIGGCYVTGVPYDTEAGNLFETYYAMFPTMILLCLYLYAFALCTSNLNLALSMGARRTDFFWALQGIMVFYAVVCWALQWLMSVFPAAANWAIRERFTLLGTYSGKFLLYPMLCIVLLVLGCLSGLVMVKNKILGSFLIVLSCLVMIGATVVLLLSVTTGLFDFVTEEPGWAWLGSLPAILTGVLAVSFAGGELLIWRAIRRYSVR